MYVHEGPIHSGLGEAEFTNYTRTDIKLMQTFPPHYSQKKAVVDLAIGFIPRGEHPRIAILT